jgi:putative endonuclease
MPKTKIQKGNDAEWAALHFFQKKGFTLLAQNFRKGKAEIDIIVRKDRLLVFAEIKFRKNDDFGFPENFLKEAQKERIRFAAECFAEENKLENCLFRFDILAITGENQPDIVHFEDAF